jgi:hypothetical protein
MDGRTGKKQISERATKFDDCNNEDDEVAFECDNETNSDQMMGMNNNVMKFEFQLLQALRDASRTEPKQVMTSVRLKAYEKVLDNMIDKDKRYGCILQKIKEAYQQRVSHL